MRIYSIIVLHAKVTGQVTSNEIITSAK
jgi:hypothetical protein